MLDAISADLSSSSEERDYELQFLFLDGDHAAKGITSSSDVLTTTTLMHQPHNL